MVSDKKMKLVPVLDLEHINPQLHALARPIGELKEDPKNARLHPAQNMETIRASLKNFRQQKPIVVHNGIVIAGNGTLRAARVLGWTHLAAVDFDDSNPKIAKRFALADNRTGDLSHWDFEALAEEARNDIEGLLEFWNEKEIQDLIGGWKPPDPTEEWKGMPEFQQEDQLAKRQLIVNFKNEEDAELFGELIGQPLAPKARSIWFPKVEPLPAADKCYVTEDEEEE